MSAFGLVFSLPILFESLFQPISLSLFGSYFFVMLDYISANIDLKILTLKFQILKLNGTQDEYKQIKWSNLIQIWITKQKKQALTTDFTRRRCSRRRHLFLFFWCWNFVFFNAFISLCVLCMFLYKFASVCLAWLCLESWMIFEPMAWITN